MMAGARLNNAIIFTFPTFMLVRFHFAIQKTSIVKVGVKQNLYHGVYRVLARF
jgi:hypothetical protein